MSILLPEKKDHEMPSNPSINLTRVGEIKKSLVKITLPYEDDNGQVIQLWKTAQHGMVGTVHKINGTMLIVQKDSIRSMISTLQGDDLMESIEKLPLRKWVLLFDVRNRIIKVMAILAAAGKWGVYGHLDKINSTHLNAVRRELAGEIVAMKPNWIPFDHIHEVFESQQGLLNLVQQLKSDLAYENRRAPEYLNGEKIRSLTKQLSLASRLLDWSEKYLPRPKMSTDGSPPPRPENPAIKKFMEELIHTRLTESYNSSNRDAPMPKQAGTQGQIGGVGCSVDYIPGLFDTSESLFELEHQFFIPEINGEEAPFSTEELRTILQELTLGIYVHDTIPFFSLHFNQDTHLYPVIHPAYQNTLVGRVISMLDYYMKGYLNGAVFKEDFIRTWETHPFKVAYSPGIYDRMIDFKKYSMEHLTGSDRYYMSARTLLNRSEEVFASITGIFQEALPSSSQGIGYDFSDHTEFTNSFRIIAKQNKIEKSSSLFVLHPDFDVFYTIEPNPEYKIRLDEYVEKEGSYPLQYNKLISVYEIMKERIHDHMTKLPFCKKYFAMLGVINFFSHYFMTLKKHRKFPILPKSTLSTEGSPTLFPALPLICTRTEKLRYDSKTVLLELIRNHSDLIVSYFTSDDTARKEELYQAVKEAWVECVWNCFKSFDSLQKIRDIGIDKKRYLAFIENRLTFDALTRISTLHGCFSHYPIQRVLQDISIHGFKWILKEPQFRNVHGYDWFPVYTLESPIDLQLLPGDQSEEEHAHGKKIVGGCGLKMKPKTVYPSASAPYLLEHVGERLKTTDYGEWIVISGEDPSCPKGAMFSLGFDDLPLGIIDEKEHLAKFLLGDVTINDPSPPPPSSSSAAPSASSGPTYTSRIHTMQKILAYAAGNDFEGFTREIDSQSLPELVDYQGRNLLHRIVKYENPAFVEALLSRGVSPAVADDNGYLPLHYAAMSGYVTHLRLLASHHDNGLRHASKQGATPLFVAIQAGRYEAMMFLLTQRIDLNKREVNGYTILHCALHHRDEKIIQGLLEFLSPYTKASIVNEVTNESLTPLMLAAESKNVNLVKLLLDHGADPKIRSKSGMTALDIAVGNNDYKMCELLLPCSRFTFHTIDRAIKKCSLKVNVLLMKHREYDSYRNSLGDTPVLIALRYGNIAVFKHLMKTAKYAPMLNLANNTQDQPITLAAKAGFYDITAELIEKVTYINPVEILKALLQSGYSGDHSGLNAWINRQEFIPGSIPGIIHDSLKAGNHTGITEIFGLDCPHYDHIQGPKGMKIEHYLAKSDGLYLYRYRAIRNRDFLMRLEEDGGKTLAYIAGENRSQKMFSFLLEKMRKHGIPLEGHYLNRHLFYSVFEAGDLDVIKIIVDASAGPGIAVYPLDETGIKGVHLIAKSGDKEVFEYLDSLGVDFRVCDHAGHDTLYYAVRHHNTVAIDYLLGKGLPVEADTLYAAAGSGNKTLFNKIQSKDININRANREGNTALLLAAKEGRWHAFLDLFNAGASLTVKNTAGWSPLLYAAHYGHMEMLKFILSRVSHPESDTVQGANALHSATRQSHVGCMQLLIEKLRFSIDIPDDQGQTVRSLATKSFAGKAIIGHPADKERYDRFLIDLKTAIRDNDPSEILSHLDRWLVNTFFFVTVNGKSYEGTLLHNLLKFCKKCTELREIVERTCLRSDFNPKLKDSEGNSYAHLLADAGINPIMIRLHGDKTFILNESNDKGLTPLHIAASHLQFSGFSLFVQGLKQRNISLDLPDTNHDTAVYYAIRKGNLPGLECLLQNDANPDHRNLRGITPLMTACSIDRLDMIRLLLKYRADMNLEGGNHERMTPLMLALKLKKQRIARHLIFQGAQAKIASLTSPAHLMALTGNRSILRFLFEKGASLCSKDSKGLMPIHFASTSKKTLTTMKEIGISLHSKSKGITPLHVAASEGTVDAVKWLLKNHADPLETGPNRTVLESAISNTSSNAMEILALFKDYLLSTDLSGLLPAIKLAIVRDYVDPLKLLYDSGVSAHSKVNEYDETGLHYACRYGSLQCTEFFLTKGIDFTSVSKLSQTPLELSAANNNISQFRMMLNYIKPELTDRNSKGETLLHVAVKAGNLLHTALLLAGGADLDSQDVQGQTPLFIAAVAGTPEIIKLLMICGANSNIATSYSRASPCGIAKPEIRSLIENYSRMSLRPGMTPLLLAKETKNALAEQVCLQRDKTKEVV